VAAQALYQGQAFTAKLDSVKAQMQHAADEEIDHLAWCEDRLAELGSQPSLLNPIWYAGSFAMGALAGAIGDKWSLGFVEETEKQVVEHLQEHLDKLPKEDTQTRVIIEQMQADEEEHGDMALLVLKMFVLPVKFCVIYPDSIFFTNPFYSLNVFLFIAAYSKNSMLDV